MAINGDRDWEWSCYRGQEYHRPASSFRAPEAVPRKLRRHESLVARHRHQDRDDCKHLANCKDCSHILWDLWVVEPIMALMQINLDMCALHQDLELNFSKDAPMTWVRYCSLCPIYARSVDNLMNISSSSRNSRMAKESILTSFIFWRPTSRRWQLQTTISIW